ncbi:MAG: 6-pyruvoyl-tetrahydropterin synthase-related protein, partial [Patescibacteria group bacterium]|nr:6-pyruvoyl-tetrahydropterin synthase-related protein [Patescibacteria group bacterium]
MFLYPGLSYFSALIHLVTKLQFITIFKLLMLSGYIGSGFVWFRWMRTLRLALFPAFVSTIFYLLAPYRLVNIFVRGALGEHIGFFFFPLIMLMATQLWRTGKTLYSSGLALSVAGLILSHNLSALMYLPLVVVYPIVLIGIYRQKPIQLKIYFGSILLGLSLSAFFWLPAILESKYTLASWMFDAQQGYTTNFLAFRQLIWSPWGYGWSEPGIDRDGMSFQVGIAQWLVLLTGIGLLIKFSKQELLLLKFGLTLVRAGIFLSLPISLPIWRWILLLQKFQFPWRFLSLIVIGSSLISAIVADKFKHSKIISLVLLISPIMFTIAYWKIAGPSTLSEQFLAVDYVGTSDTGETTPVWAIRFQEKFPKAPVEIVSAEGAVEIKNINKLMQKHEFEI